MQVGEAIWGLLALLFDDYSMLWLKASSKINCHAPPGLMIFPASNFQIDSSCNPCTASLEEGKILQRNSQRHVITLDSQLPQDILAPQIFRVTGFWSNRKSSLKAICSSKLVASAVSAVI